MRLIKYLLIFLSACLIISCGLVKTAYNNAPALTAWWLDDYFDFTAAQNAKLKPALQDLHDWHRKNELPHYVALLNEIQSDFSQDKLTADKTCQRIDAIKSNAHALQVKAIPIIVEMAGTLSDKQLQYFQEKLEKRTEKWKADWWQENTEDQLNVRLEKSKDFAQKVYGDLSESQINLLKQSLAQSHANPAISYAEILRRNEDAFNILKALQNPALSVEEKSQLVNAGFERMQKSPNQAYEIYESKITQQSCETIASLHATTDAKQKLHAKNWLSDYIAQLNNLHIK
ncbi:MAG: DUF6279 family lipoprotein [Pseudomonadota bacterium]